METYLVPLSWVMALVIIYPIKVIVSWIILKISNNEKRTAWITFLLLSAAYLIFISFQSNRDIEVVLNGVTLMIPPFVFYLVYDLYKTPKIVRFLHHIATRISIALISLLIVAGFYVNYDEPLFLKTMVLCVVYFIFFVRKRRNKQTTTIVNDNEKLPV